MNIYVEMCSCDCLGILKSKTKHIVTDHFPMGILLTPICLNLGNWFSAIINLFASSLTAKKKKNGGKRRN